MITEVDNYRGYEIRFDTNNETFRCDIDDSRSVKKSYTAIKTFIDEWLKDNANFKKFKVICNPLSMYGGKAGTIIGQRKDGRYYLETPSGVKEQVSDYNLKDHWILTDEVAEALKAANPILAELKALDIKERTLKEQLTAIYQSIPVQTLEDYKKANSGSF